MISIIDDISETFNNLELVKTNDLQEGEIILDPNLSEDVEYKYIQRIGDTIITRNNNDEKLTPDGLLTVESQIQKIQEMDEQTNKERPTGINNLIKLRCVVCHLMELSPLTDTRFMSNQVKNLYIRTRDTYIIDLTQEKLDEDFGRVCHETIFENGEDVSKYPIFL